MAHEERLGAPGAVAGQRNGGRHHASDHRHRGHHDRLGALVAGIDDRGRLVDALVHLLEREIDQQDRVLGYDTEQHQDADIDGQRQRIACDEQRDRAAQRRQQQRAHIHQRRHQPLVEQHQHREHQHDPGNHRDHEVVDHLVFARFRFDEIGMVLVIIEQAAGIFLHIEEIRLFFHFMHRAAAVRAIAVHELAFPSGYAACSGTAVCTVVWPWSEQSSTSQHQRHQRTGEEHEREARLDRRPTAHHRPPTAPHRRLTTSDPSMRRLMPLH